MPGLQVTHCCSLYPTRSSSRLLQLLLFLFAFCLLRLYTAVLISVDGHWIALFCCSSNCRRFIPDAGTVLDIELPPPARLVIHPFCRFPRTPIPLQYTPCSLLGRLLHISNVSTKSNQV